MAYTQFKIILGAGLYIKVVDASQSVCDERTIILFCSLRVLKIKEVEHQDTI